MRKKLTITVDEELVPRAKRFAQSRGVSLSQLIETALREMGVGDLSVGKTEPMTHVTSAQLVEHLPGGGQAIEVAVRAHDDQNFRYGHRSCSS